MLIEEGYACWSEPHEASSVLLVQHEKSAIIGVFPNGEFGAGGTPRIHHFFIAPILFCEPLKKIQDQAL